MRKGTNKRGFIASQPAAQIAALDFTHQSEAFRRALVASEAAHQSRDLDAADAAGALAGEIADRLLGIPTSNPAHIAEKVAAFCFSNHLGLDLANPAHQRRIAESGHEEAKGLLAIYLDLQDRAAAIAAERERWDHAVLAFENSLVGLERADRLPEDDAKEPAYLAAFDVFSDAWQALIDAPAPDAAATVYKLRIIINHAWNEDINDTPDSPALYQRHLNETVQESAFPYVRLLQDACRQSGIDHPAVHLERQS